MFFLNRKKDKKPRATNPAWLKWMVMIFIGYAIFINYTERQRGDALFADGSNAETYERADFGSYVLPTGTRIGGEIEGTGMAAGCGQTADVTVVTKLDGKESPEEQLNLQVGLSNIEYPWAPAIVGMKQGGVREIKMSRETDEGVKKLATYKVEMATLTPSSPETHVPFQGIDRTAGSGNSAQCGMTAEISLIVRGADGLPLYDSAQAGDTLTMTLGQADLFYGLDRGILGMKQRGERTLIIPPAFAITSDATPDALKQAVHERMVVAEVALVKLD